MFLIFNFGNSNIEKIAKEYKIIFNLEDPTLESSISNYEATQTFTCEDKFVLYRPLLTGYTFKGWFDGKTYDSPVQVLPHNTSGDWVLTGKFVLDQYDINYYIGSAENDIFLTFSQKKLSFAFLRKQQKTRTVCAFFYQSLLFSTTRLAERKIFSRSQYGSTMRKSASIERSSPKNFSTL